MNRRRWFSLLQLIAGSVATVLVFVAYLMFSDPVRIAIVELDALAANAESEIASAERLLKHVDGVAASLQQAIPSHRRTLSAVGVSAKEVARTVGEWEQEVPGIQAISKDVAQVCETFASQLPIRIPTAKLATKQIKYQLPEFTPKTQQVDLPYPSAKVSMKSLDFGKIAGKSLGRIQYPGGIDLGTKKKTVTVPAPPEMKMKNYTVRVPSDVDVTYRELLRDEQAVLEKSAVQLGSINEALERTQGSLGDIKRLLQNDVHESLTETERNLTEAESALNVFRTESLPSVLVDLGEQRIGLSESRGVFAPAAGLVPLVFGIAGLTTFAVATGGAAKYFGGA